MIWIVHVPYEIALVQTIVLCEAVYVASSFSYNLPLLQASNYFSRTKIKKHFTVSDINLSILHLNRIK